MHLIEIKRKLHTKGPPMIERQICLAAMLVLGIAQIVPAQGLPSAEEQTAAPNAMTRQKKPVKQDPAATTAQRQSGVSEVQARSLLQQQGYASITTLQAQPNSIWVWQADVLKNGRRVRLGIDYRGNVAELGGPTQPCAMPGMSSGVGGFGVGSRLSESTGCAGR